MSKYLGKLVLERGIVDDSVSGIYKVLVKYCVSSKRFLFKCFYRVGGEDSGGVFSRFSFYASEDLCWKLVEFEKNKEKLDFQYVWSMGYAVREKRQDVLALHSEEMNKIGLDLGLEDGRKGLLIRGDIDSDYNFDVLCAIQHMYCLSSTVFGKIISKWSRGGSECRGGISGRWVSLKKRDMSSFGRKLGSKNKKKTGEGENMVLSEKEKQNELERVRHNKKVAVLRGYLGWWVDACKEECALLGVEFDKVACLEQWKNTRKDI